MILNASGCLDALTAPDVARGLDAFVTKTVTPLPREGNAPERIAETDGGDAELDRAREPGHRQLRRRGPPAARSSSGRRSGSRSAGSPRPTTGTCARGSTGHDAVAIELNLSCPNVAEPEDEATAIVAAARAATSKPLYAKLSPALPDIAAVALAAAEAGADGLSLVNTIRGLALDPRTLRPRLATATGGLSGPGSAAGRAGRRPRLLPGDGLPIVGMGGVETGGHALELIAAGALCRRPRNRALRRPRRTRRGSVPSSTAEASSRGFPEPSRAPAPLPPTAVASSADALSKRR